MNGRLPAYKKSFFLSPERQDGLQLQIFHQDGIVYSPLLVDNRFEGYAEVLHGGMIFGILDVIIWYAIVMKTRKLSMTRKVEMEFYKPVMCSNLYVAKGEMLRIEEKDIYSTAWVEDEAGEVYARMNAVFREGKGLAVDAFVDRFDFSATTPEIRDYFLSLAETGNENR
ncbi:MAG: PaaI family thioesterase [Syntrophorhabdaceae bacterium]|nr:PaaI family thioesterase [Syntrophorhabdaceae bacterium]